MKNSAIVFDLDDTLTDTRIRHYKLVSDYLQLYNIRNSSYSKYLQTRKDNCFSNHELLKAYFPSVTAAFGEYWEKHIESMYYLQYDYEIVNRQLLNEIVIRKNCELILLSLRTDLELAKEQFSSFSFSKNFNDRIFVPHNLVNPKVQVLKTLRNRFDSLLFIGDTKSDADAAMEAQVAFYGVSTGFYPLSSQFQFPDVNHILLKMLQ